MQIETRCCGTITLEPLYEEVVFASDGSVAEIYVLRDPQHIIVSDDLLVKGNPRFVSVDEGGITIHAAGDDYRYDFKERMERGWLAERRP